MIEEPSTLRELFIKKLLGLTYRLDNTGNSDFAKNGEKMFVKNLANFYKDKAIVIFDIGAHKGDYTDFLLEFFNLDKIKIHLFEPQASCAVGLQAKFKGKKNITINNIGLSSSETTAILYKESQESALSSVYKRNLKHYNLDMGIQETVRLMRGDRYIREKAITHIHLLKVDVEGHEIEALNGFGEFLIPSNVDFIQFEYGGANLDSHTSLMELYRFFEERGFIVCKIMAQNVEVREYQPRLENFMYQNWVAVSPRVLQP